MRHLVVVVVFAACGTPRPQLLVDFTAGPSQSCPSANCAELDLPCEAVMGVRIFDPKDHDHPLLEQCDLIPPNREKTLCAYRTINLEAVELPIKDLEVQVTIYPVTAKGVKYDEEKNEYTCPPPIEFSAIDLPLENQDAPALGGRGYYHPGDEEVNVVLGCTDLKAIKRSCAAEGGTQITATVNDFETRLPVTRNDTAGLRVAVGEPREFDTTYVLNPIDEVELKLVKDTSSPPLPPPPPTWTGEVDLSFNKYICLDVLEFGSEVTPVLQCSTVGSGPQLDLRGIRLHRHELRNILMALDNANITSFPEDGLTIGIVLDPSSRGAPDYVVDTGEQGTVTYLSGPTTFGGTKTSNSGIFVSTDAPFGTRFTTSGARPTLSAIGGKVAGKVTVVILPPATPQ